MSLMGTTLLLQWLGNIGASLTREQNNQVLNLAPFYLLVENSRTIPGNCLNVLESEHSSKKA
jgi:hypothetical protein